MAPVLCIYQEHPRSWTVCPQCLASGVPLLILQRGGCESAALSLKCRWRMSSRADDEHNRAAILAATIGNWVAVKEFQLSYHNGYI